MGPIDDFTPDIAQSALQRIAENSSTLDDLKSILEDPGAYTKSGRVVTNPRTSQAVMTGANNYSLGAAEGKTVAQATKEIARINNENAILRAVAALGQEVQKTGGASIPKTPPPLSTPGLMSKLNPILTAVQLLTYPSDLNQGEDAELAARRSKGTSK